MICPKCKKAAPEAAVFCPYCGKQLDPKPRRRRRANGEGEITKRGSVWQVRVCTGAEVEIDERGVPHSRRIRVSRSGFATKAEAAAYAETLRSGRRSGRTVGEYYAAWLQSAAPKLSASKQTAYRIAWNRMRAISGRRAGELSIIELQRLLDGLSYYQARDIKSLTSHIYELAVVDGEIPSNPARHLKLPQLQETAQEPFTDDEILTLWQSWQTGERMAGYALLMIYTGMMPGELLALRKDQIDLDTHQIRGAGLKTKKRRETPIVLSAHAEHLLQTLCALSDTESVCPLDKTAFYDAWKPFLTSIGVRPLPAYSCRHTTATALAVGKGVDVAVIKEVMRHAKITTTARYMHPDTAASLEAVNRISGNLLPQNSHQNAENIDKH